MQNLCIFSFQIKGSVTFRVGKDSRTPATFTHTKRYRAKLFLGKSGKQSEKTLI